MTDTNETLADINDEIAAGALTDRQARFVFEYMKDQNASAAARRCGYAPRSACNQGNRILSQPAVRDRIRMEMRDMLAELKLSVMDLIRERMKAAFFRNGPMFGADRKLLPIEEMPADFVALFDVGLEMRKGEPILRLKQPSRERALSALEKAHDKLDRLDEKYHDQLERVGRQQPAPVQAPIPQRPDFLRDGPRDDEAEKPHHSSSSPDEGPEKPHHLSSEPQPRRSVLQKAFEKLHPKKKPEPDEPYDFMKDPNAAWGGTHIKRKPVEPSPALLEHLARVKQEEHDAEIRAELARRGGKIRPGEPSVLQPPGFNPWARDNRPQYAIGAGECSLDD